jgi:hypothetical protein
LSPFNVQVVKEFLVGASANPSATPTGRVMSVSRRCVRFLLGLVALASQAVAADVTVGDGASLHAALRDAKPGMTIRIAPGAYPGDLFVKGNSGTADAPIIIEAANPADPPTVDGGENGIQLSGCSHVVLRNLRFRGQTGNGLNIDDGGKLESPAAGIVLEWLHVSDVGPRGNHDGIKLSGLKGFRITDCIVEGWGGGAIDMVGCHDGAIERCTFRGKDGFEQSTGPQLKGGTSNVAIRRCDFVDAGQRAINVGGSTELPYFRPPGATWEAKNITVEDCRFVGGEAAVAFVGVDGAAFGHNTIVRPRAWVLRILQETVRPEFVRCRDVTFERNLVVYRRGELREVVNRGMNGQPQFETFRFAENWWYAEDDPPRSKPELPTAEKGGVYGRDPEVTFDERGLPAIGDLRAARYGARGAP